MAVIWITTPGDRADCTKVWKACGGSTDMNFPRTELEHNHAIIQDIDTVQRCELPS